MKQRSHREKDVLIEGLAETLKEILRICHPDETQDLWQVPISVRELAEKAILKIHEE